MKLKKWGVVILCAMLVAVVGLFGCANSGSSSSSESTDKTESGNTGTGSTETSSTGSSDTGTFELVKDGKILVAASLDFPPFENMGEGSTEAEGFSVDLMKALGEEMGLEVEYLPTQNFDAIIPLIQTGGTADVGVSSFTVTDERLEQVDFTDPYMQSNQGVVVMKDSGITDVAELEGKTIATQSGTTGYDWAVENIPDATVDPYTEMTAVFAALQSGQADAVVADLPVVQYYVKNAYQDAEVIDEIPTGEEYAIAVNKNNPGLTEKLNEALKTLQDNGTYDELYKKWFGVAPSGNN